MAFTQFGTAVRTGYFYASFEVLDSYGAVVQINITYVDPKSFRDPASQTRQKPDEKAIPGISGCSL
jgi:hypothetical protein